MVPLAQSCITTLVSFVHKESVCVTGVQLVGGEPAEMEMLSFELAPRTPHLAQMKLKLCVGIVRSVM